MNDLKAANLACGNPKDKRREADFYPTPKEVTQSLINTGILATDLKVWEPCCGTGDMSKVLIGNGFNVKSSDLYDRGYGTSGIDVLTAKAPSGLQIVTNPPFGIVDEIIRRSLKELNPEVLALVLKSQFWHSKKRYQLFQDHQPAYVLPLSWRPDFSGVGGSPTMEVLWTIWKKGSTNTIYYPLRKPC